MSAMGQWSNIGSVQQYLGTANRLQCIKGPHFLRYFLPPDSLLLTYSNQSTTTDLSTSLQQQPPPFNNTLLRHASRPPRLHPSPLHHASRRSRIHHHMQNALGRSVLDAQCRTFGPYTEPANCSGGCASASGKAVGALSENSRYCCELKTTYLGGDD